MLVNNVIVLSNLLIVFRISSHPIWSNDVISSHVFSLLEDKKKSKLRGVMRATKYYDLHMFLYAFRSFLHCFQAYSEYISRFRYMYAW